MSDSLDEVWEWIVDQNLDSLKDKQKAFELTTQHFKNIDSNKIRISLIKRGFFEIGRAHV